MNHRLAAVFVLLAALASAPSVTAQIVSTTPENPTSWDASFHIGWLGGNKSPVAPDWNDWYDAASFSASAGYYWTPNLKLEADVSTSATASITHDNVVFFPGDLYPYYRPREHRFRATQAAIGLHYQFFENRWFHPFVGGGAAATYETERADALAPGSYREPPGRGPLASLPVVDVARTTLNPYITAGFKVYVTERAFVRSDVRATFSSDRAEWVIWRGGVGFDF